MRELAVVFFVDVVVLVNATETADGAPGTRLNALAAEFEAFIVRPFVAGEHVLPAQRGLAARLATCGRDEGGFIVLDPLAA